MILRIAIGAKADMALFELFRSRNYLRTDPRRIPGERRALRCESAERGVDELAHAGMIQVSGGGNDHVGRHIRAAKILEQRFSCERLDGFLRSQDRAPER